MCRLTIELDGNVNRSVRAVSLWVGESADSSAVRMDGSGVRSGTVSHPSGNGVGVSGSFGLPSASSTELLDMEDFIVSLSG